MPVILPTSKSAKSNSVTYSNRCIQLLIQRPHIQFTGCKPQLMQQHFKKNDKVSAGPVCHIRTTLLRTAETARAEGGDAVSTILPLPCGFIHPAGNLTLWVFRNQEVVSTPGLVHVQSHANYLTMFPSCICLDPALTKISLYFCVFPLVRLTQPRCLYRIWHKETLVLTECFGCSVAPAKR